MNIKATIYLALLITFTLSLFPNLIVLVEGFINWNSSNIIGGLLTLIVTLFIDLFLFKKFKFHKMQDNPVKSTNLQASKSENIDKNPSKHLSENINKNPSKHLSEKNITFKAKLSKPWTLLDDRIIYENDEILLSDIQVVHLISLSESGKKGVIEIKLKDKRTINLAYPNKSRKEGEKAFIYIYDNSSCYKDTTRKHMRDVLADINILYFSSVGTSQFILRLPNILSVDEHIKDLENCSTNDRIGIIVCTNKRVLIIGMNSSTDIPLYRINSVSYHKNPNGITGTISITDGGTTRTVEKVSNQSLSSFTNRINKEIANYNMPNTNTVSPIRQVINTSSCADELIKFKQLLDAGALTQEEFDRKKKELLKA